MTIDQAIADQFCDISPHAADETYQAGVKAWQAGQDDAVCPYTSRSGAETNGLRIMWLNGFYNARIYRLLVK